MILSFFSFIYSFYQYSVMIYWYIEYACSLVPVLVLLIVGGCFVVDWYSEPIPTEYWLKFFVVIVTSVSIEYESARSTPHFFNILNFARRTRESWVFLFVTRVLSIIRWSIIAGVACHVRYFFTVVFANFLLLLTGLIS
jgi:hypothetical protein